jgi:hypothetical protein
LCSFDIDTRYFTRVLAIYGAFLGGGEDAVSHPEASVGNAPPLTSRRHLMLRERDVIINIVSYVVSYTVSYTVYLRACYLHLVCKYMNCLIFYQAVCSAAVWILSKGNIFDTDSTAVNQSQTTVYLKW